MSVLTENQTLALAQLEVKAARGTLSDDERWERTLLSAGRRLPSHRLSLGGRAATSLAFKGLAAKGLSPNLTLNENYFSARVRTFYKNLPRGG